MAQSTTSADRIDASPRPQHRLRRITVLAVLCVLFAIVGSIVRHVYRPLSDVEQRLVGTWRHTTIPAAVFTFHSDRTITSPLDPPGRWSVHEDRLYTTDEPIVEALRMLFRNRVDDSMDLTFEDEDTVSVSTLNGVTHQWQRVSSR